MTASGTRPKHKYLAFIFSHNLEKEEEEEGEEEEEVGKEDRRGGGGRGEG